MSVSALKIQYLPGSKLHPTTFLLKASLYLYPLLRMMPSVGDEPQRRKVTQHRFFLAASQTKHWADFFFFFCATAHCSVSSRLVSQRVGSAGCADRHAGIHRRLPETTEEYGEGPLSAPAGERRAQEARPWDPGAYVGELQPVCGVLTGWHRYFKLDVRKVKRSTNGKQTTSINLQL